MANRIFIALLLLTFTTVGQTQSKIDKRINVKSVQRLEVDLSFANLVKLDTWKGNDILITGSYSINNGENNDAFRLDVSEDNAEIIVKQFINDLDNLPRKYVLKSPTQTVEFNSRKELKAYKNQNPDNWTSESNNVDIDVELTIKVPEGLQTSIFSKFGTIEIAEFSGPLKAHAKFGALDIALASKGTGTVSATAKFGEIYTDLDWPLNKTKEENFKTSITSNFGQGHTYDLISEFGSLYIRKSKF